MYRTITRQLVNILEGKKFNPETELELKPLIELATNNKILLQLLTILDVKGSLRKHQEKAMKRTVHVVDVLSKTLNNFDCTFFKLVKPVRYVPSDVDILVKLNEANKVAKKVKELGYRVVVKEPYCITLVKGLSIIDLYAQPTIGGVAYMDGQAILEHTKLAEFNGVEVRTLKGCAEVLVVAAHAVYKERIYTLNDYFAVKEWVSDRSFKLADELNCRPALELALNLNRAVEKGFLQMPYRLPLPAWIILLLRKLCSDHLTRATSINLLKAMQDPLAGKRIISKLTRRTY